MYPNKNRQRRLFKLAIILIALSIIVYIVTYFVNLRNFRVVSTDPITSQVASIDPYMVVNFNKQLVASSVRLSSTPKIIQSYEVQGRSLTIKLSVMELNKSYTIIINSITATNNQVIKNQDIQFTTRYIPVNQLPKGEQNAIKNNQVNYKSVTNNPIVKYLPHTTLNYSLIAATGNGTNNQEQFVLQATIYLNQADMTDESTAISNYEQEVVNYIQSLGFNPSNYKIDYVISTP
ncbi:MAG: hypothetical protein ACYCPS_03640 [Candidatus Saccharimonadales bacterium]